MLLGSAAMVPFAIGTICSWLGTGTWSVLATDATIVWGCAILTFLAGVRRGVSFRTPGGATFAQIATALWLYMLGLAALLLFVLAGQRQENDCTVAALLLLLVGYISIGILDRWAARRGEAPLFFARLRPVQMLVPVASLAALIGLRLVR